MTTERRAIPLVVALVAVVFSILPEMPSVEASQTGSPACTGPTYELTAAFIGTWHEFAVKDGGEEFIGTLKAGTEVDNCVFTQRFESPDGSFSFMSFGYVEPERRQWQETFVLSNGRVATYRWSRKGEDVVFDRLGSDPPVRLRVTNLQHSSYDVIEERSADARKTWVGVELTRTRRVE